MDNHGPDAKSRGGEMTKKPISTLDFLIVAKCSGSARSLAAKLGMDLHMVHIRLLVLRRKGIVVVFQGEKEQQP